MIRFACPHCSKKLKAPRRGAGRKIPCPRCGRVILIPPPVQNRQQETEFSQEPQPTEDIPVQDASSLEYIDESPEATEFVEPPFIAKFAGSKPTAFLSSLGVGCLFIVAGLFICTGLCLVLFYWVVYDTSVPYIPGNSNLPPQLQEAYIRAFPDFVQYVHNTGRMQNRMIGTIVGFGLVTIGMAFGFAGIITAKKRS